MVQINMRITHDVRKAAGDQVADMGKHVGQQGVACNVEGNAKPHVAGPLVKLTMKMALGLRAPLPFLVCILRLFSRPRVGDVELGKHVAWWQHHLREILGVPGAEDEAAIVGIGAEGVDDALQLIDPLPCVVGLGIDIVSAKVAPLEAVNRAKIPHFAVRQAQVVEELARPITVPDLDSLLAEGQRRRVGFDEPQELRDDGAREDALRGEEGKDRRAVAVELEL